MNGLVLFSGGLDSTTALAVALEECEQVLAVTMLYGAMHGSREAQAAEKIVKFYSPRAQHEWVALPNVFRGGLSALLGESEMPEEEYHDIEKEVPSATVVPYRNGVFISIAAALASARGIDRCYIAVHATDARGFAYPDCTPEFIGAQLAAIYIGSFHKVRLVSPFQWNTKADIVRRGLSLGVPYSLTWSCYRGGQIACGRCPTCRERQQAFIDAGSKDPIEYENLY